MATATPLRQEALTVTSFVTRAPTGELRVNFEGNADGFTLDQLDALEHAINIARRQMLNGRDDDPTVIPLFAARSDDDARYREQLSRMAAPG